MLTTHIIISLPALRMISNLIGHLLSRGGGTLVNTEEGGEFYGDLRYSNELY